MADLRAHRQEQTRTALRATIEAGGLDAFRGIVESLAEEFDVLDVAAAALKQAGTSTDERESQEIPTATVPREPAAGRVRRATGRPNGKAAGPMTRVFVGGGRALRITAGDLVGAIANEAGVSSRVSAPSASTSGTPSSRWPARSPIR